MSPTDHGDSGLFVGFEGYRSTTDDDRTEAITSWLVVLDTNVLLGLYNYQGASLDDFIEVFRAIGDRLFIPHQVMDEFWRNRRTVLQENQGRHREQDQVQKHFDEIESLFKKWHLRVVDRASPAPKDAVRELAEAREAVLAFMETRNAEAGAALPDTPTHEDPVLRQLEPLLVGRIGPEPTSEQLADLMATGRSRIAAKVPPGYMDAEKNPERAIGDYMVWRQTVDAAKSRAMSVLFVTQDQKEDWWADRGSRSMRARPELVRELLQEAGQRLLMVRAPDLIQLGRQLGVDVSDSTVTEASLSTEDVDGWTAERVASYLAILEAWPQHMAILVKAVHQNGEITRAQMAEILGREEGAAMTGIGRPYYTALTRMLSSEDSDDELWVPLYAEYEGGGWMSHFSMAEEMRPLFEAGLTQHLSDDT